MRLKRIEFLCTVPSLPASLDDHVVGSFPAKTGKKNEARYFPCEGFGLENNNKQRGGSLGGIGRLAPVLLLALVGCKAYPPPIPPSQGHIQAPRAETPASDIPPPVKAGAWLPPPRPVAKPETYSVVVNEVPVKELLFALARDSKVNIDVHPAIQGVVTLNAINETLPAIMDRLARQVNLRYQLDGKTLTVVPDTPYLRTYRVNYVNVARNTSSSIGVATQIASSGGHAQATAPQASAGAVSNSSNTTVSSNSANNFWELLSENIRSILTSTKAVKLSAEERSARMEAQRAAREERLQQVEAAARAGAGAPTLFTTAFGTPAPLQPQDSKHEVIVNPAAGSVTVLASERQQEQVRQYLDSVMDAVQRQVLIEATIVEVTLSDKYKAGVDWSRLASGAGFTINQQLLAGNLATAPFATIGYANTTSTVGNIAATISLLESFGNIRVLSSPKLMALNNQTALLKVVNNVVYFSIEVQQGTSSSTGLITQPTYTTTAHTVPVGVVMAVTPQIDDRSVVTLTVRPTISRVVGFKNDPNPALGTGATRINNPVPEVQVREMESVLQVQSGQTVILGGLMQDDVTKNRDGVPGLSRLEGVGDVFSYRDESVAKTELVIFLRPTSIVNASLDSDELKFFRRYLPSAESAAQPSSRP